MSPFTALSLLAAAAAGTMLSLSGEPESPAQPLTPERTMNHPAPAAGAAALMPYGYYYTIPVQPPAGASWVAAFDAAWH